jgi:integrase
VRFYDASGRRRPTTCGSREEAEFERARLALEQSRAVASRPAVSTAVTDEDGPAPTLGQFYATWLADASSRLASSTVKDYEGVWRRRLAERFAEVPMNRIRPRDVSLWRTEMLADGLGAETVRRAMVLLQAMFTVTIELGEVTANPVSVVRKPRQGRDRAVEPLLPEQVERLRWELLRRRDRRSASLVVVMAYAGLRPGEALALSARHVREGTILVERAVSDGLLKRQKTGRAYRTVDLLEPLAEDLAARIDQLGGDREALLFARSDGGHWRKDDWDKLVPPLLRPGRPRRRPEPAAAVRPAPCVRVAADPRAAHVL